MKYYITVLGLFIFSIGMNMHVFAQSGKKMAQLKVIEDSTNQKTKSENIIRTSNDLKTGNWQDVLTSFFQLSISDLTGNNKALNFKTNLLSLKAKADSSLLIDSVYIRQKFARNFQFNFSLNLDSQYKFNGFKSGFTWAIINKRDSSVMSIAKTQTDMFYGIVQGELQNGFMKFQLSVSDTSGKIRKDKLDLFLDVKKKFEQIIESKGFTAIKNYPAELQPFFNKIYDDNLIKADELFNAELEKVRRKPLLTLSVNSTFKNDQQSFNNGEAGLIYLQGLSSKTGSIEIDLRSTFTIKDTTVIIKQRRSILKSSLGLNISLAQTKSQKSIIELKPYFEYENVLSSVISNEERNKFTANADLRLRITDDIWLPFTIKYDIKKGNFLGFLNVAVNLNAFKKQITTN